MAKVYPVILSGGSGTRLWPKSRTLFPKQFHSLTSEHTLLQEALLRVVDKTVYANPMVVCNEDHRFVVAEQAEAIGVTLEDIVLEPEGRNTAPAVAVAAALIRAKDPNGLVLVLASDHHIGNPGAFGDAVKLGVLAAVDGFICTFGIAPTSPETGYGYIKRTSEQVASGVYKIDQFKEKPDLETAKRYVADSSYAWNAGLFLFSAERMMSELAAFEPSIGPACEGAIKHGVRDEITEEVSFLRLSGPHFAQAKAMSVDYAIMERTTFSAVIPLDARWTDVGSWPSLYQTCLGNSSNEADKAKNIYSVGEVRHKDTSNCYLSTDGPLLATIGIKDLCVVATEDAVLVLPMDKAQEVGVLAKALKKDPATSKLAVKHITQYKPWGLSKTVAEGDRFKVLMLTIKPGAATSLQMHFHRAMHQVVVRGTALVTKGDEQFLLQENQSCYGAIGQPHRLENPGKVPLVVMEVQSGSYLGEDDIIRLEDAHATSNEPDSNPRRYALATGPSAPAAAPTPSPSPPAPAAPQLQLLPLAVAAAFGGLLAFVAMSRKK